MSFINEFKAFIRRGNVLDLAIAVVIGAAFGAVVNSAVEDILMPPLGKLLNNVDFSDLFIPLDGKDYESLKKAKDAGAPVVAYGNFIESVINFIIIAFAVFVLIKAITRFYKKEGTAAAQNPVPTRQEELLTEIRDLLKNK